MSNKLLLINTTNDEYYTGDKPTEILEQVAWIARGERRLVIFGKDDTVRISNDYNDAELIVELAARAMQVMVKYFGFTIYQRKD